MKTQTAKNLAYISFIMLMLLLITRGFQKAFMTILCVLIGIRISHLLLRRIVFFRPYFVSKYNIFTSKTNYTCEFNFSKNIAIEKIKEALVAGNFKIININEDTNSIFAVSKWNILEPNITGENIYIDLIEMDNKTRANFCSATIGQSYSFGRNKQNYETFLAEFEKSLTI